MMELIKTIKVLGCIVFALMIYAVPVLTGLSIALGWPAYITGILAIASLGIVGVLIGTLCAEVDL